MKEKWKSIVLLTAVIGLFAFTPSVRLFWEHGDFITWKDYKGEIPANAVHDAETSWGISYSYHKEKAEIRNSVRAFMEQGESWVKNPSESLLEHEQIHFDIAELYAREFRKYIDESLTDDTLNNPVLLRIAYNEHCLKPCHMEQERYDAETQHGQWRKGQQVWAKNIKKRLAKLNKFSVSFLLDKK